MNPSLTDMKQTSAEYQLFAQLVRHNHALIRTMQPDQARRFNSDESAIWCAGRAGEYAESTNYPDPVCAALACRDWLMRGRGPKDV